MFTGTALGTAGALASSVLSATANVAKTAAQARARQSGLAFQQQAAQNRQNLAERQADEARHEGYAAMMQKKRETADALAARRAAMAGSGTAVDSGTNLDRTADAAARGEAEALDAFNRSLSTAWGHEVQAANAANAAKKAKADAEAAETSALLTIGSAALGGLGRMRK